MQYRLFIESLSKERKDIRDAEIIYENIKELQFLKNLLTLQYSDANPESAIELCYNMKYERYSMGTFVFKEKDESNGKFYVILSGEVGVIIRPNLIKIYETDRNIIEMSRRSTESNFSDVRSISPKHRQGLSITQYLNAENRRSSTNFKLSVVTDLSLVTNRLLAARKPTNRMSDKIQSKDKEEHNENEDVRFDFNLIVQRFGELRHILTTGNSFGDAALKQPGTRRSASILCKTDCEFLIIDEYTYTHFIKKWQEHRTNFLWKCFSFLPDVSSKQVKNLIFYSFKSKTFGRGEVVTLEGQQATPPIIYVLEIGECKVEKRWVTKLYHPFKKSEAIQQKMSWITVCNIGAGTVIGEEILLHPEGEEVYEYKVTVTSKKVSMMWIEKNILLGIHPALQEQLKQFYEFKKLKRDQLYEEITKEYRDTISKLIEHDKKPFMKEHADIVRLLRHSSLNILSNKSLHNKAKSLSTTSLRLKFQKPVPPDTTIREQTQNFPQQTIESPLKNSFLRPKPLITSHEIDRSNTASPLLDKPLLSPAKTHHSSCSQHLIPTSERRSQITLDPSTSTKSPQTSNEQKKFRLQVERLKSESSISPQSLKQIPTSPASEKPFATERVHKRKFLDMFSMKEKGYKTIRQNTKDISEAFAETFRESSQSLAHMAFIDKFKCDSEVQANDLGLMKFEPRNRAYEVTRMKKLGKDAFSARLGSNYAQKNREWVDYLSFSPSISPFNTEISKAFENTRKDLPLAKDSSKRDRNLSSPNILTSFSLRSDRQYPSLDKDGLATSPAIARLPTDESARLFTEAKDSTDNQRFPLSPNEPISSINTAFLPQSKPEPPPKRINHSKNNSNSSLVVHYINNPLEVQTTNSRPAHLKLLQTSSNRKKLAVGSVKYHKKLRGMANNLS